MRLSRRIKVLAVFNQTREWCACSRLRILLPSTPTPSGPRHSPSAGGQLTCEGIHESGQRPIEHLEERISARLSVRAAQDGVLQDVRDARAVHGSGAELHAAGKQEKPAGGLRRTAQHPGLRSPRLPALTPPATYVPSHKNGLLQQHRRSLTQTPNFMSLRT